MARRPIQNVAVAGQTREQNRKDVRRATAFIRAMRRLGNAFPHLRFDVKCQIFPNFEIVEAPEWDYVKNLLSRFRPIYLDSDEASFRSVVRSLPKHVLVQGGDPFGDLEARWDAVLISTTATIPPGARIIGPGVIGITQAAGTFEVAFDGAVLSGREAIDLSIYGELSHLDLGKERKLLRISESLVAPGYRFAVMSLTADLVRTADELRLHAEKFIELFRQQLGDAKLDEIETEFDPK